MSREAERLKVEKNSTVSGRRYSTEYWNYVMANRQKLSGLRYVHYSSILCYPLLKGDILRQISSTLWSSKYRSVRDCVSSEFRHNLNIKPSFILPMHRRACTREHRLCWFTWSDDVILVSFRLCKKSVVRLLRCSLNFLYRDTGCRERERRKVKPIDELLNTVSEDWIYIIIFLIY